MTSPSAAHPVLAKGWGRWLDCRTEANGSLQLLMQFNDEEAPRWITSGDLAEHRRALLAAKHQLLTG